jgi:hypothetical protein
MNTAWCGPDGAEGRMLSMKAMLNLHSNDLVNVGTAKEPDWRTAFDLWMRSELRREYNDAGYYPVGSEPAGVLNLFRGLAVEPRAGRWDTLYDFLANVICDGDDKAYEFLSNLIFWKIQNPTRLPEIAILLIGVPGSGRDTFAYILNRIFGDRHYKQFTDSTRVGAKFNILLEGRVVVFYDETFFGHDPRIKQILKGEITEPWRIIEPRHRRLRRAQHDLVGVRHQRGRRPADRHQRSPLPGAACFEGQGPQPRILHQIARRPR